MAAPSLFDGVSRACREVGLPSIGLLGLVWYIGITYGELEAGLTYVVLTGAILLGTYVATKYWNSRYTLGFAVTGLAMWVGGDRRRYMIGTPKRRPDGEWGSRPGDRVSPRTPLP